MLKLYLQPTWDNRVELNPHQVDNRHSFLLSPLLFSQDSHMDLVLQALVLLEPVVSPANVLGFGDQDAEICIFGHRVAVSCPVSSRANTEGLHKM
jgi:hypothetical protein